MNKNHLKKIFLWSIALFFSGLSLYPLLYIFSVSLRGNNAFFSKSLALISKESSFNNYIHLFTETDFGRWLLNSCWISLTVALTGVFLSATCGYTLSRFQFTARKWVLLGLMTTQMFPATMLILPFFVVLSKLHLMNSYWGLWLIYSSTALPFCIWQMKGYFDTLPRELEEAALMDGCSWWGLFWKIIIPVSTPALVITGLFSFMTAWSEYIVAAVVLQNPQLYTLPLGLKSFQSSLSTQWGLYAAAALLVGIPVVVVFIAVSRYLVSGLTLGSVK